MLQGLDDSTDGRSKGVAHGEQLLDMLDQVRDGLLAGGVPRSTLNRLANAVIAPPRRVQRSQAADAFSTRSNCAPMSNSPSSR